MYWQPRSGPGSLYTWWMSVWSVTLALVNRTDWWFAVGHAPSHGLIRAAACFCNMTSSAINDWIGFLQNIPPTNICLLFVWCQPENMSSGQECTPCCEDSRISLGASILPRPRLLDALATHYIIGGGSSLFWNLDSLVFTVTKQQTKETSQKVSAADAALFASSVSTAPLR